MRFLPNRDTLKGIIVYYINLLIFIASGIGTWENRNVIAISIFTLSFVTLMLQDIEWFRRCRVHPQDKKLIEKISELMENERTLYFIREKDLAKEGFDSFDIENLDKIYEWAGIDHEFIKKEYQDIWGAMRKGIHDLMDLLYENKYNMNANLFTLINRKNDADNDELEKGRNNAEQANALARDIYTKYQELRKYYISKMQAV